MLPLLLLTTQKIQRYPKVGVVMLSILQRTLHCILVQRPVTATNVEYCLRCVGLVSGALGSPVMLRPSEAYKGPIRALKLAENAERSGRRDSG